MFGDNQSVITSSTLPHSKLAKRHNALAYHRVREAVASGIMGFYKIDGEKNPADILSKHCGFPQAWPLLKPLLFWGADTTECSPVDVEKLVKADYEKEAMKMKWTQMVHKIIQYTP